MNEYSEPPFTGTAARTDTRATPRKFRRSRDERMIAGVCGGAARLFDVDATLVRILLIVATLLGFGTGFFLYVACWLIVPEQP